MNIRRRIGEKGQVVIPMEIRERMGLKPDIDVLFDIEDNKVTITRARSPREIIEDFVNVVPIKRRYRNLTPKNLKKIFEEEYEVP